MLAASVRPQRIVARRSLPDVRLASARPAPVSAWAELRHSQRAVSQFA